MGHRHSQLTPERLNNDSLYPKNYVYCGPETARDVLQDSLYKDIYYAPVNMNDSARDVMEHKQLGNTEDNSELYNKIFVTLDNKSEQRQPPDGCPQSLDSENPGTSTPKTGLRPREEYGVSPIKSADSILEVSEIFPSPSTPVKNSMAQTSPKFGNTVGTQTPRSKRISTIVQAFASKKPLRKISTPPLKRVFPRKFSTPSKKRCQTLSPRKSSSPWTPNKSSNLSQTLPSSKKGCLKNSLDFGIPSGTSTPTKNVSFTLESLDTSTSSEMSLACPSDSGLIKPQMSSKKKVARKLIDSPPRSKKNSLREGNSFHTAGSIEYWLRNLCAQTEVESLNSLQVKPMTRDPVLIAIQQMRDIHDKLLEIEKEFNKMNTLFKSRKSDPTPQIKTFLNRYGICSRVEAADFCAQFGHQGISVRLKLLEEFQNLVNQFLTCNVNVILKKSCLDKSESFLKTVIVLLTSLGHSGEKFCRIITQLGGIQLLLKICRDTNVPFLKASSLRALTVISCVKEAAIELEWAGGVKTIAEILEKMHLSEGVRNEAAGLMVQLTSPWLDSRNLALFDFSSNAERFAKGLTQLCKTTSSSEVFLLSTAGLANLAGLDESEEGALVKAMKSANTVPILIESFRKNDEFHRCLFIQEQVAILLRRLAMSRETRDEVSKRSCLAVLVRLLRCRLIPEVAKPAEVTAAIRVQEHASAALGFLARTGGPTIASHLVELGGASRLAQLCQYPRERMNSEAVKRAAVQALSQLMSVSKLPPSSPEPKPVIETIL